MKRISFMFLIKDEIYNEEIWYNFFLNVSPDKYKIYIHYKNDNNLKYFNKYKLRNCIQTSWGDRSLVDAHNLLIEESLKDNNVTHLILISDTCIPLKKFDYIYKFLDENYSYFHRKNPDLKQLNNKVYYFLNKNEIKKSSQWCILNRKHAKLLYNKEYIIKYYENNNYPDERVYITALDKFGLSNEIKDMCITHCVWPYKSSHPVDFGIIRKKNLYNLLKSNCLFARKFTNCYVIDNRQKIYIGDYVPYLKEITSVKSNIKNIDKINIIKDIGFDGNTEKYNKIIENNSGNILHSLQDIILDEHEKYKKLYLFKEY
jgi:type IV secretory pathway protease TraF